MGIPVDQFMQVSCKFQLTSETEFSESVHGNQERVRLCTSAEIDKNSTLIVMICSNELGNNHIVAYYIEKANESNQPSDSSPKTTTLAKFHGLDSQDSQSCDCYQAEALKASKKRPRVIVRQIYYHNYNEDIVALALSESGNKLALVNASSTIYILPIKNILLDLDSSQSKIPANGKATHFYDAAIIDCQLDSPISVAYWEDLNVTDDPTTQSEGNSMVIVAGQNGDLSFISVDEKKVLNSRHLNEKIQSLNIIQDKFTYSLLINCNNFKQFRLPLELMSTVQRKRPVPIKHSSPRIELPLKSVVKSPQSNTGLPSEESDSDQPTDVMPSLEQKPMQIKFSGSSGNKDVSSTSSPIALPQASGAYPRAAAAFHRVLGPSGRLSANKTGLFSALNPVPKERPVTMVFYQSCSSMVSVVDVLGEHKSLVQQASNGIHRFQASIRSNCSSNSSCSANTNASAQPTSNQQFEPRLLRFYPSKQFNYRSHKPDTVCRLSSLDPDELIKQVVLTDRFLAIATDRDRCLINSRNCCNVKGSSHAKLVELDPLVKEIRFASQEKILTLIRSPISNDKDEIIDSFLLVTTRSLYSIEARRSCRDTFVGLIDSHLGMSKPLEVSRRLSRQSSQSSLCNSHHHHQHQAHCRSMSMSTSKCSSYIHQASEFSFSDLAFFDQNASHDTERRDSESHLLINNFLNNRDELYERICYDSRAFSVLFKLELGSLYEAYGDKLLLRRHFRLADRFFKMANFSHSQIIGKYIRLAAYREMINYVTNILTDENEVLDEKERIDLSKAGFECLLAKTLVERSKTTIYNRKIDRSNLTQLVDSLREPSSSAYTADSTLMTLRFGQDPYQICEHTPRGGKSKLSSNTIVAGDANNDDHLDEADEGTLMADFNNFSHLIVDRNGDKIRRLECERSLINFVNNLIPQPLYSHVLAQLIDFGLVDLADSLACSDVRVNSLIRILLKAKDEFRIIFREGRLEKLKNTLKSNGLDDLVTFNKAKFLEVMTTPKVTKALAKDTSLTSEYIGPQQRNMPQFRKYSVAALRQLDQFRALVLSQKASSASPEAGQPNSQRCLFSKLQKHSIENIFIEFLKACLYESTGDSCRLWFNYINFYLNYVGSKSELQGDILHLVGQDSTDARIAITLFKAIEEDELDLKKAPRRSPYRADYFANTPLESMELHNLSHLFDNVFLMTLLEKTLILVPESADLDALSDCLGVDGFMGQVPPVEHLWREIFKSIKTAAGSKTTLTESNRYPVINSSGIR